MNADAYKAAMERAERGEFDNVEDPHRSLSVEEYQAWSSIGMGDVSRLDPELRPYVQPEETRSIVWVKHPLVFQTWPSPNQANYALRMKKRLLAEAERDEKWGSYIFLHERPHRMTALWTLWSEQRIGRDTLRDLLPQVWLDTELPHQFGDVPVWLFAAAGFVHDLDDDCETPPWNDGDMVRIYRGANAADPPGISWTTDHERAVWFSKRWENHRGPAVVFTGLAPAHKIRGYFTGRNESEVVIEPDDVVDLTHSGGVVKALLGNRAARRKEGR